MREANQRRKKPKPAIQQKTYRQRIADAADQLPPQQQQTLCKVAETLLRLVQREAGN